MGSLEQLRCSHFGENQSMLDSAEALKLTKPERCMVKECDCPRFITSGINAVDICKTCGHRDFDHQE